MIWFGEAVYLNGSNFSALTTVKFGGVSVTPTYINENMISVTAPAVVDPQTVDITVTDEFGQTNTLTGGYVYNLPAPTVTSITPNKGPLAGGQNVTVSGSGFVVGKTRFKQIVAGGLHSCGVTDKGKVYCWGYNNYGQLGNNSTINNSIPVAVNISGVLAGKNIVAIAAADYHTIALDSNGQVYTWGYNSSGQLGNNTTANSSVPVAVNTTGVLAGKTIKAISSRSAHNLALDTNGQVYAWGSNAGGQLGNSSTVNSSVPVVVNTTGVLAGKTIVAVSANGSMSSYGNIYDSSMALDSNGLVYSWGSNLHGQLGNNSTTNSLVAVAVNTSGVLSGKFITKIASGNSHVLALDSNGLVYAWGYNGEGELGNNSTTSSLVPVSVNTTGALAGKIISDISAGDHYSTAKDSTGHIYSWGYNGNGQLGNNTTTSSSVPVSVASTGVLSGKNISAISAGGGLYGTNLASVLSHTLALDTAGNIYSWGYNANGQLGNNSTAQSTVPVSVTPIYSGLPTLSLGGSLATNVNVVNSTTLTATTSAHAASLVDTTVTNYDTQSATLANSYNYK
ncbi:hypothetical protein CVV43_05560, partial [Candidatus Saccharibacteria bacterium HGW-Saccharibacteria-1]